MRKEGIYTEQSKSSGTLQEVTHLLKVVYSPQAMHSAWIDHEIPLEWQRQEWKEANIFSFPSTVVSDLILRRLCEVAANPFPEETRGSE